jgi:hypothetical protein
MAGDRLQVMRILKLWFVLLAPLALLASCGSADDSADDTSDDTIPTSDSTPSDSSSTSDTAAGRSSTTAGASTTDSSGDASAATTRAPTVTTEGSGDADVGTVNVGLEPVEGYFIEGFEVGLRFETVDGEVIDALLWTDIVAAIDNPTIDDFYETVHRQPVPAGQVVVLATVSIGAGPPPVVPDLRGPMQCELVVDVAPGGETDVEVSFEREDCLSER